MIDIKSASSLYIAVAVTIAAVASGIYVERRRRKQESDGESKAKELDVAAAQAPQVEEEKTEAPPSNKKLLVLISSYSPNIQQKTNQDRAFTIIKGLKIGDDQIETIDGAVAANREKRNELFGLSGIRAKYPQFFLVDGGTTKFLADWDGFEAMNEMGTLKESVNLS
jgi:hypothetical protein